MSIRQPIAIVHLDIGEREEQIHVYQGDDVGVLAQYFCERHNLGKECIQFITIQVNAQIKKNLKQPAIQMLPVTHNKNADMETLRSEIQAKLSEYHQKKIQANKHKKKSSIYDKLYTEALVHQQTREEQQEHHRRESDLRSLNGVSFQPQVSPSNDMIVSKLKRNQTQLDVCEYLYEESVNKRLRQEHAIENRLKDVDDLSSPKPLISQKSRVLLSKLKRSKSELTVHERLYQQAQEISKQREQYSAKIFQTMYPFKPKISSNFLKKWKPVKQKQNECERYQKQQEKKRSEIRLFQPSIPQTEYNKKVYKKRQVEDRLIAEQIRCGKLTLQTPKNRSRSPKVVQVDKEDKQKLINQESEQKTLQEREMTDTIFNLLDGDQDGFIDNQQIDLSRMDLRILQIIACVLVEMEENKMAFNSQQFYESCYCNNILARLVEECQIVFTYFLLLYVKNSPFQRYDQSSVDYDRIIHKVKY